MMHSELIQAVKAGRVLLFAGSGISATLGVPTWKGLVNYMAAELGYDPRVLAPPGVNYLTLAEYFRIKMGSNGIAALSKKMTAEWNVDNAKLSASAVLKAIYDIKFPLIYTTNYDQNLENAFRLFGGDPLVVSDVSSFPDTPAAKQVIVKFHGDVSVPDSLVLAEEHYFRRLAFETPLDVRLRSDALSYSILFVGYSLSDINIRLLLYKLSNMWRDADAEARPRSFLLLQRPNEMEKTVLASWGVEVLTHDVDNPDHMLRDFLEKLHARVSGAHSSKYL
jgi:hypothetical protein